MKRWCEHSGAELARMTREEVARLLNLDTILITRLKYRDRVDLALARLTSADLPGLKAILAEATGDWRRAAIRKRIKELETAAFDRDIGVIRGVTHVDTRARKL
jgi:hypothetical protein